MDTSQRLPPLVLEAVADLKRSLIDAFGARLCEVRVFGSVARGEVNEESDVDVLVVLDRIDSHRNRVLPMEIAYDAGSPRGLIVQALVLGADELEFQRRTETALADALDRDGVAV